MAEELKVEGNALFASRDYDGAAGKYSAAIALDPQSAVLYSNRAACYHALSRHEDGLSDATKATEIDPTYSKGWHRMGACADVLGYYPQSIESYQMADNTASTEGQEAQCQAALQSVEDKILDPNVMQINVMEAVARAHDIPLPISTNRDVVYQALSTHPLFGTEPKLRLLLIPQSQTAPLTQHELHRGPDIELQIAALLDSASTTLILLYSEDQIAYVCNFPFAVGCASPFWIRPEAGLLVLESAVFTPATRLGRSLMQFPSDLPTSPPLNYFGDRTRMGRFLFRKPHSSNL
ncbi:hypothetical protein B0H19DRAFT_1094912 [Mycena capillaripes]|nr:hypothetical protein B0H19DRAFT_1094912 [Mycena capillaripes]